MYALACGGEKDWWAVIPVEVYVRVAFVLNKAVSLSHAADHQTDGKFVIDGPVCEPENSWTPPTARVIDSRSRCSLGSLTFKHEPLHSGYYYEIYYYVKSSLRIGRGNPSYRATHFCE